MCLCVSASVFVCVPTFLAAREGERRVGLGGSVCVCVLGFVVELLWRLLGVEGGEDADAVDEVGVVGMATADAAEDAVMRTAMSSVQVRRRLRRYSSVSRSTTSKRVSPSTALMRCTTCRGHQRSASTTFIPASAHVSTMSSAEHSVISKHHIPAAI